MTQKDNSIFMKGEYITLGQLLKFLNLVNTGGEEKIFLVENNVTFNGMREDRRGKKLRPGDIVGINGKQYTICSSQD